MLLLNFLLYCFYGIFRQKPHFAKSKGSIKKFIDNRDSDKALLLHHSDTALLLYSALNPKICKSKSLKVWPDGVSTFHLLDFRIQLSRNNKKEAHPPLQYAGATRFELAISSVTGRRVNRATPRAHDQNITILSLKIIYGLVNDNAQTGSN